MGLRARVVASLAAIGLAACGLSITGADDKRASPGGAGGAPDDPKATDGGPLRPEERPRDGGDAGDGDLADLCASARGTRMVSVDNRFCIDAIETTNEDYLPFFLAAAEGKAGPVPPQCAWNASYLPGTWSITSPYFPNANARLPVRPIDWCDAFMFCQWSGKRLCGSLDGGAVPLADAPDAAASAWTYACSAGGTKTYPYGSTYNATACSTDQPAGVPTAAGSYPACVGGYPEILDMSGNAWEWDDSCGPGNEAAECGLRGGSVTRPRELVTCATALRSVRNDATGNNGIRCCKYD